MSTIRANSITNSAGSGAPDFPNGITVAGGTTLSAIATQAEAEAGTDNTKLMTPLRTSQAVSAQVGTIYKTAEIFSSSGTFTTPAGVTEALAFVIGGGGGGGGTTSTADGGFGGFGGFAFGTVSVSGSMAVTVGAGGAGTNSAATGGSGGSSSFGTLSATGGAGGASGNSGGASGANGVGSGGVLAGVSASSAESVATFPGVLDVIQALLKTPFRPNGAGLAAVAYSLGGAYIPGAVGDGETDSSANDASGGVGGAVIICY